MLICKTPRVCVPATIIPPRFTNKVPANRDENRPRNLGGLTASAKYKESERDGDRDHGRMLIELRDRKSTISSKWPGIL